MPSYNTYKGVYTLSKPEKYIGDKPPYYRSSWESMFYKFCEMNDNVVRWIAEGFSIPYQWPDGSTHKYIPDIYVEIKDKNGVIQKYVVEIKPVGKGPVKDKNGIVHEPKKPLKCSVKSMKRYLSESLNYQKNVNKWKAAEEFCSKHNMKFIVLTDHDFLN